MSISAPHVIFQVTLVPDKSCLPRMSKKLTQQGSMNINSSGHAGLLVNSSWKIWLRDVMKTKQLLAAIRGLRERIIHTNKAISQGSYKTVINPAHCSQINRMTAEAGRNRQAGKTRHSRRKSWRTQTGGSVWHHKWKCDVFVIQQ